MDRAYLAFYAESFDGLKKRGGRKILVYLRVRSAQAKTGICIAFFWEGKTEK